MWQRRFLEYCFDRWQYRCWFDSGATITSSSSDASKSISTAVNGIKYADNGSDMGAKNSIVVSQPLDVLAIESP